MKILMSSCNPDGKPLEQALTEILEDMEEKQAALVRKLGFDHTPTDKELAHLLSQPVYGVMAVIYCNNRRVLGGLREALEAQTFTLRALDTLGKDQVHAGLLAFKETLHE